MLFQNKIRELNKKNEIIKIYFLLLLLLFRQLVICVFKT